MAKAHRGEIWQVDFGIAGKVRPALVVNIDFTDSERALYAVVAHTTAPRGTRFEVALQVAALQPGVFDIQQLVALPEARLLRQRAVLTVEQMRRIEDALSLWLGLRK
jgi:mRNA interferase MazF